MNKLTRSTAAGLLLALPLALSACGSSGDSKPSKADVKAGYVKAAKKEGTSGMSDSIVKQISDCIVDKTYDDLDEDTLTKIKDADTDAKIKSSDKTKLSTASTACAKTAMASASGSAAASAS